MKKNIPIMQVFVAVFAMAYPWGKISADTVINSDTTQEGGNLTVDTPVLIVSDETSSPTLTLTDGAQGQWSGSPIIGNLNGETGNLVVSAGSSLVTTGANQLLGTYGLGNVFSGSAYLGLNSGAVGTAVITGGNSIWEITQNLFVGVSGSGTVNIEDGGAVSAGHLTLGHFAGATGTLTLSGPDASASISTNETTNETTVVGRDGTGTVTIQDGAAFSTGHAILGQRSGSSGSVTITGTDSVWNVGGLSVGVLGTGSLTVENGGLLNAETLRASLSGLSGDGNITTRGLVFDHDSTVTLTGTQTTLSFGSGGTLSLDLDGSTGTLGVGYRGNGTLLIQGGAEITSGRGEIGTLAGSNGNLTISGENTSWTINNGSPRTVNMMVVGQGGTGTLRVETGALLHNESGYIGFFNGSSGSATVTGADSVWTNTRDLYVGFLGDGNLAVEAGGVVSVGRTLFTSLNHLDGNGEINTKGLVVDNYDLEFNSERGPSQTISFGSDSEDLGSLHLTMDGTGGLGAGYRSQGSLTIQDGLTIQSSAGWLGYRDGSEGVALVSGAGTKWEIGGSLFVGHFGQGELTIENGAVVQNTFANIGDKGGTGVVVVSGAGSEWNNTQVRIVDGSVTVQGGALVTSTSVSSDPAGSISITGSNSAWNTTGDFRAGQNFMVEDGANVSVGGAIFATLSEITGNGTISAQGIVLDGTLNLSDTASLQQTLSFGTGGSLEIDIDGTAALGAGFRGAGEVTISNGVEVVSTGGFIGVQDGSNGVVNVLGAGTTWTNQTNLYIGGSPFVDGLPGSSSGGGSLNIENGSAVHVSALTRLYSGGSINVLSGSTFSTSNLDIQQGEFNLSHGTVIVENQISGNLTIGELGLLTGSPTLSGNLINQGTLSPGNSPGIVLISGDYTHESTATLMMEIGGVIPGTDHDQLSVGGTFAINGGTLQIAQWNDFMPSLGDTFTLFTFTNLTGSFDAIDAFALSGSQQWDFTNLYTEGTVTVIPEPATIILFSLVGLSASVPPLFRRLRRRKGRG